MIAPDLSDSLQHYPIDMSRFGTNPYGENRFRIVHGASRRSLVVGQWNGDGAIRAKWCRTYPGVGNNWILEEWLDAFTFTGITADQWNADPYHTAIGPYPHRGEYQMCGDGIFQPMDLGESGIAKLISMVHAADKYTWAEKLAACRNKATKEEIERSCLRDAIIRDAFPAFGHAPFSQLSTGRGGAAKTSPVLRSANELCLPVPEGIPGQATTGGGMIIPKKKRRAA